MIRNPSIQGALRDRANLNVWDLVGSGAPTNGVTGSGFGFAGPGSNYVDVLTGTEYVNSGTKLSPLWSISAGLAQFRQATGSIVPADIIGTGAGQFGHAAGVPLLAAPGAANAAELISLMLIYDFAVAAYTAGGNITVNRTGGAAITGLVSAANSVGNAADRVAAFVPLAVAAEVVTVNIGFSLVSSAAFTNPGTAAGVIRWVLNYRVHATGF